MSPAVGAVLAAERQQLPEDIGKAGPLGLLLIVVLLIAVAAAGEVDVGPPQEGARAASTPTTRCPRCPTPRPSCSSRHPGQELLDTLRRAPLAIEPPAERRRPAGGPAAQG